MNKVNLRRVRKQLLDIYQDFTDFVYHDEDIKEVILVKRKEGWLQVGHCKEFGIPISIIFDKLKYVTPYDNPAKLTVMFSSICIFDAQITVIEKISLDLIRRGYLENASRENAIQSCIKYASLINAELYVETFNGMQYEELCSTVKKLREQYVSFIGDAIIEKAITNDSLMEDLRSIGLTTVASFHERNIEFIEKKYDEVFRHPSGLKMIP